MHLQVYRVTTADGYILNLFRIGKDFTEDLEKPTLLLQHGLMDSNDHWVWETEDGLDFTGILTDNANNGNDIWLGNNRGTKYSLGHRDLDSEKD